MALSEGAAVMAISTLSAVNVGDLEDEQCDLLLTAVEDMRRRLLQRHYARRISKYCDVLRVLLPTCQHYCQYEGGLGDSASNVLALALTNALALALTCKDFRDEVFHHFPRSGENRLSTGLQVQSVSRLQCARDLGGPWNVHVCGAAAEQGIFEVLRFAVENGCPWDPDEICLLATPRTNDGSLEMLRWVMDQEETEDRAPAHVTSEAMWFAAQSGRLDSVQYLFECVRYSMPLEDHERAQDILESVFDDDVFPGAAAGGHLDVLKWLLGECQQLHDDYFPSWAIPWGYTCEKAAERGHLHIVAWARENGCPSPSP